MSKFKLISPLDAEPLFFSTVGEAQDYLDDLPEPKEDRDEYQIIEVDAAGNGLGLAIASTKKNPKNDKQEDRGNETGD